MRWNRVLVGSLCLLFWACGSGNSTPAPTDTGVDAFDSFVQKDLTATDKQSSDITTAPDPGTPDIQQPDVESVDVAQGCVPGSGCFGEACDVPADCLDGFCVPHLGDSVCSRSCVDECPSGFSCRVLSSGGRDLNFVCVSDFGNLCLPCVSNGDCSTDSQANLCLSYGDSGRFCGGSCGDDMLCPDGFICELLANEGGGSSNQCIPVTGICSCAQSAINLGLSTTCSLTNDFGSCEGSRFCAQDGLTECDAVAAQPETCNGIDDNCSGQTDEGSLCDDENPCTLDQCNGADGCINTPLEGTVCDDGKVCTETDLCVSGLCSGVSSCDDENGCTDDTCDVEAGCVFTPNEALCEDGNACTLGDQCSDGACTAGVELLVCDDENGCTDDTCDSDEGCVETPNTSPCDDSNACTTVDVCDGGTCLGSGAADCNDQNACTDDSCNPEDGCVAAPNTAACSDSNVCTIGDLCSEGDCTPGSTSLPCDDGNPCTDDSCDPDIGCVFVANTAICDDGDACTLGDVCSDKQCVSGAPPALVGEACDGADLDLCTEGIQVCEGGVVSCNDTTGDNLDV